jgi:hypothetical protein
VAWYRRDIRTVRGFFTEGFPFLFRFSVSIESGIGSAIGSGIGKIGVQPVKTLVTARKFLRVGEVNG